VNHWLVREEILATECWVNYECFGGLQSGLEFFFKAKDLSWLLVGDRRCLADLDNSGAIDFADILAILSAWGNIGGPEDLDGSGAVDFGDLVVVLSAWGPCA
jgi:hypothetical protein